MENKPPKNKRHIVEGHYTTTKTLIKAAQELHSITGAHVKAQVIPTWLNGVRREFVSDGFPMVDVEMIETDAPLPGGQVVDLLEPRPGTSATAVESPLKSIRVAEAAGANVASSTANRCHHCGITYGTDADERLDSPWLGCASKACTFWVHARCANVFYQCTEAGYRALGKWADDHFFCDRHMPR